MSGAETVTADSGTLEELSPHGFLDLDYVWNFDVIRTADSTYFKLGINGDIHWRFLGTFPRPELTEEEKQPRARRKIINTSAGLISPQFDGNTNYSLAIKDSGHLEHWLIGLGYSELSLAAQSLGEQIRQQRLQDCIDQIKVLNDATAQDPQLRVLLTRRGDSPAFPKNAMAKLTGFYLAEDKDQLVPGLVVANEREEQGKIPDGFYPFGVYIEGSK